MAPFSIASSDAVDVGRVKPIAITMWLSLKIDDSHVPPPEIESDAFC
jgi:hypothetical protein